MKNLFIICLLLAALSGVAQQKTTTDSIKFPGAPESNAMWTETKKTDRPLWGTTNYNSEIWTSDMRNHAHKEDADIVNAILKFPKLNEVWGMTIEQIFVYNEQGYLATIEINPYDDEWNFIPLDTWEFTIPAGTYDFLGHFCKKNTSDITGWDPDVCYIAENVEICEGSIVEFKPDESTICLTMETTIPNGDKTRFRTLSYDENWNHEIIEEGNVYNVNLKKIIILGDFIVEDMLMHPTDFNVLASPAGEYDAKKHLNFYVNQVSERYLFREIAYMPAFPNFDDGLYVAVTEARGSHEGVYTNEPFYDFTDNTIDLTPAAKKYPMPSDLDDEYPFALGLNTYFKGTANTEYLSLNLKSPDLWKIWTSRPEQPVSNDNLYLTYNIEYAEAYIPITEDWGSYIMKKYIASPQYFPYAEAGNTVIAYPHDVFMLHKNADLIPIYTFPCIEYYASVLDNLELTSGSSAPLLTMWSQPYYDWYSESSITRPWWFYTGRVSESLSATDYLSSLSLSIEGKEIADNTEDAIHWVAANQDKDVVYDFTVVTDNFEIDGITGGNIAHVSYANLGIDNTPPTATMLQFRDVNDKVTQIFESNNGATLLLSAADMEICEGEPFSWGDKRIWMELSSPEKVEAWVSANGANVETISRIELTEKPEGFSNGLGALFMGSLSDIDITSPNGWFDLTILVEDAAGNKQIQTLSPAFKIDSLSGTQTVAMKEGVRVSGRNVIAPVGTQVFTVNGIEVGLSNLAPGIYIVKTSSSASKIAIK